MVMKGKAILLALAFVCFGLAPVQAGTVYITADNLEGTNLFGTLDVATGQFRMSRPANLARLLPRIPFFWD